MSVTTKTDEWLASIYRFTQGREVALIGVLLLAVPLVTGNISLSTYVLIFGLFAMGYNLALGETGMLTFGHAAFFGLGAYGSGLFLAHVQPPAWLGFICLITGTLLAAAGGLVIGLLSLRRRGTYLALITLAFAEMIYFVVFQWKSLTGGDDGLFGVMTPKLGIPGVFMISFSGGVLPGNVTYYLFSFVIFMLALVALRRIKRSNFGRVLNAVRENENRAQFLGYDVNRYRLAAFTLSAAFSGLAGALYAPFLNYVGLDTLNWVLSGEVNFYVLLGGIGSFPGAVIGTFIYYWLSDTVSTLWSHWQLLMGLILIAIVLFFPEGILGAVQEYVGREAVLERAGGVGTEPGSDSAEKGVE
ncbi:MAG: branched-chain amino acid ABC transporter permease [Salinigranum sp.]